MNTNVSLSLPLPSNTGLTHRIAQTGRNFITFLGRNTGNLVGTALAVALLSSQWFVTGTVLLTTCSYNILSNAITSFPTIPSLFREYFSRNMFTAATAALGCALVATQCHVIGVSILLFTAFQFLDSNGFIPRKASLFIERYFPLYSLMQHPFLAYSPFELLSVCSYIAQIPPIARLLYDYIDKLVRRFLPLSGPSVQDAHGGPNSKQRLNLEEIHHALENNDSAYQLDLEHCSQSAASFVDLKADSSYEKLQDLLNKFNWEECTNEIFTYPTFISHLEGEFPWENSDEIKKNVLIYATRLAQSKGIALKDLAKDWMQKQMQQLIRLLNGRVGLLNRVVGYQSDFDDAAKDLSKVIPYLEDSCKTAQGSKEAKALLLKLTLQSSGKQADNIKKIANEILHKAANHHLESATIYKDQFYEFKLRTKLQDRRLEIIRSESQETANSVSNIAKVIFPKSDLAKGDTKGITDFMTDFHRSHLSFGFLPISDYDRNHCNLPWQYFFRSMRTIFDEAVDKPKGPTILEKYLPKIYEAFSHTNDEDLWIEVEKILKDNLISKENVDEIYRLFKKSPESETTKHKFRRLVLVALGILKPKR